MKYADQIKDPRWQKKRLEILKRDEFTCQQCGNKELTLHVHHKHYNKGAKIWEYENWELTTLCENCHSEKHNKKEIINNFFLVDTKYSEIVELLSYYDKGDCDSLVFLLHEVKYHKENEEFEYKDFWFKIFDSFNADYYNELLKICNTHIENEKILIEISSLKDEIEILKKEKINNKRLIIPTIFSLKDSEDNNG